MGSLGRAPLTSLPYIMRWCVVMSALKTTIQLLLAVRSSSVSARWGMLTFSSLVQWIRSGGKKTKQKRYLYKLLKTSEERLQKQACGQDIRDPLLQLDTMNVMSLKVTYYTHFRSFNYNCILLEYVYM